MGILSLNKLLKAQALQAFFLLPLEDLRGKRVAIDVNLWMCANIRVSRQYVLENTNLELETLNEEEVMKHWLHAFCTFTNVWLRYGITPVYVFDGPKNADKKAVKEERQEKQKKSEERISSLLLDLQKDIFSRPHNLIADLKKELANARNPGNDHYIALKKLLRIAGLPYLEAETDAEKLCTSLALEGHVAAVYSRDTDNLAFGCPLLLTSFVYQGAGVFVEAVRLDLILNFLEINLTQFVDLCILCGCDFGGRIPGCGPMRAYDLVSKYHNIDLMPEKYQSLELNHKRCREIFAYKPSKELTTNEWFLDVQIPAEEAGTYLFCQKYNLHFRVQEMQQTYENLTNMSGLLHEGAISKYGLLVRRFNNRPQDYFVFQNILAKTTN